mgnify:CR=1 FL=1
MKRSNAHFLSKYSNDAIFISLSAVKTNSMLMMSYDTWLFLFSLYLLCEEVVMESEWIIKSSSEMKKKNHWIHHWKGIEWWTGREWKERRARKIKITECRCDIKQAFILSTHLRVFLIAFSYEKFAYFLHTTIF